MVAVDELGPLPGAVTEADVAVNLHGSGPESHRVVLESRPDRLVAFRHPEVPATTGAPAWRRDEHEVDRWCRLLTTHGLPAERRDLHLPVRTLPRRRAGSVVVIHPGAKSAARRWPPKRFGAVAADLRPRGAEVVVTGSADERPLARRVTRRGGCHPRPSSPGAPGWTTWSGWWRTPGWW